MILRLIANTLASYCAETLLVGTSLAELRRKTDKTTVHLRNFEVRCSIHQAREQELRQESRIPTSGLV